MSNQIQFLHLKNTPIFEQLQLEEALLSLNGENWCIINEGSPQAIVMGISGKPHLLIDSAKVSSSPIPLIKRYSGGGTVIVDSNTLFVTFIFQKETHDFPCYPEPILRWSASFYQSALDIPDFHLRENDYAIGKHKCAGNAQYIKKDRFVQHTTFLWDYEDEAMSYLLYPPKTPSYREGRSHKDFLCRLKEHLPSKKHFIDRIKEALSSQYKVEKALHASLIPLLKIPHRKTTELILQKDY